MDLIRLYAFAVTPTRLSAKPVPPPGGSVPVSDDLRRVLDEITKESGVDRRTLVDFAVDTNTRTCEPRDHVMSLAFDVSARADAAATRLASRLGHAMDSRSRPCLLLAGVSKNSVARRVHLWTFPQDQAFRFTTSARGPTIDILSNVFSHQSHLRKAALLEGKQSRTDFLSARVLDRQQGALSTEIADLWIVRFLGARLAIDAESGTRMLADCLRRTLEESSDSTERESLQAAIAAVRHSPRRHWSLKDFASQYLSGAVRDRFLAEAPNKETLGSSFEFRLDCFDQAVRYHVFELENTVFVSAPFGELNKSVRVERSKNGARLRCEGSVVSERVRSRHA